jgi:hypothetical protein
MSDATSPHPAIGWGALAAQPDLLQAGDIVHTQGSHWLSRAIRWFSRKKDGQRAWASHSAMVLTSAPDDILIEALAHVRVRPASVYYQDTAHVAIHRLPEPLTPAQQRQICLYTLGYEGYPYGKWKLLLHALDHLIGDRYLFRRLALNKRYPICSWLVAWAYDEVLSQRLGGDPNAVSPDDIMDHCMAESWPLVWADSAETVRQIEDIYQKRVAVRERLEKARAARLARRKW